MSEIPLNQVYHIRVVVPFHLQTLAKTDGEITVSVAPPVTLAAIVDAVERAHPTLVGTIRDHGNKQRRPLLRYFVCSKDVSHQPTDTLVPEAVLNGTEPFIIWGAIAGG